MYNVTELRNFPRVAVTCTVKYKQAESTDEFKEGTTRNISGNGIFFITSEMHEVNSLLEIHIAPGTDSALPLDAIIEVIRSNPGKQEGEFEIAGMIKNIK